METEAAKSASTGTMTQTLERSSKRIEPDPVGRRDVPDARSEPKALSAAGRTLAAVARWILFIVLVVVAPVALIVWSVTPRVTSPPQLADEAIESGLTVAVRGALVDQLSTELAEQEDSPLHAGELGPVIERSLSQDWFDEQLTLLAVELDGWLDTSGGDLPDLVIDLKPVKRSLAADTQALSLVAAAVECNGPRCPSPESALVDILSEVPDEVAFLTIGAESETDPGPQILEARDKFQTIEQAIAMVPLALALALVALVLLAGQGSRIRWLGATLVTIAGPVLAVATLLPGWASRWAASSLPNGTPLTREYLEELLTWATQPAGTAARWLLLVGVAALVTAVALGVLPRRRA